MSEAVLTSKGQITLPKNVRDAYNLAQGDKVDFLAEKGWAIMVPRKGNILDLAGSVKHKGRLIDFEKLREKIKKQIAKRSKK